MLPLGFRKIAQSLMEDEPPRVRINSPPGLVSQGLLLGSAVATMTSMEEHQDETTGAMYVSTMMTSMGLMNLETPVAAVNHWGPILEELTDADMVEGQPK